MCIGWIPYPWPLLTCGLAVEKLHLGMPISEEDINKIIDIVSGQVKENLPPKVLRQVILQVLDRLEEGASQPVTQAPTTPPTEFSRIHSDLYQRIERTDTNRIIISAFGKNRPGVVAAISNVLADAGINIQDIQQNIMQEFFGMIMIAEMSASRVTFDAVKEQLLAIEQNLGCKLRVQHEDIFRYMHRI